MERCIRCLEISLPRFPSLLDPLRPVAVASTDIEQLLFKLQKDNNSTLVLVTHDDDLAAQCQIHYRIVDGQLVTEA